MEQPNDPISGKKFITGVVSPKTGVKALAFLPWLLLFIALGGCVWFTVHTLIKPKPSQNQTFVVQPGATVNVQQKQETVKKKWYVPTPFVESYYGIQTNDEKYYGIRFGARWEF